MAADEYISLKEAQALLNLSAGTIRGLFDTYELRGMRTPKGHRKYLKADVTQLAEKLKHDDGIRIPR